MSDSLRELPNAASKISALEAELTLLKAENARLRANLLAAENEVLKLKHLPPKKVLLSGDLPETQQQILLFLEANDGSSIEVIAKGTRLGLDRARVQLSEMQKAKLIWPKGFHDREPVWRMGQEGRNYLATYKAQAV